MGRDYTDEHTCRDCSSGLSQEPAVLISPWTHMPPATPLYPTLSYRTPRLHSNRLHWRAHVSVISNLQFWFPGKHVSSSKPLLPSPPLLKASVGITETELGLWLCRESLQCVKRGPDPVWDSCLRLSLIQSEVCHMFTWHLMEVLSVACGMMSTMTWRQICKVFSWKWVLAL